MESYLGGGVGDIEIVWIVFKRGSDGGIAREHRIGIVDGDRKSLNEIAS